MKNALLGLLIAAVVLLGVYLIFRKKIDKMFGDIKSKVTSDFADKYEDTPVVTNSGNSGGGSSSGGGSGGGNSGGGSSSGGGSTSGGYYPSVGNDPIPNVPKIDWNQANWNKTKILKRGVKGNEVAVLQVNLNDFVGRKAGFTVPLVPDGDFGRKTEDALKALTGRTTITLTVALDLIKKFR